MDDAIARGGPRDLAKGQTNRTSGSVVSAELEPQPQVFFRPETEELLIVPADKVTSFEQECRELDQISYALLESKKRYSNATDAHLDAQRASAGPKRGGPQDPQLLRKAEAELQKAEKELVAAHETIDKEFQALGKLDGTGGKLYELVPIRQRSSTVSSGDSSGTGSSKSKKKGQTHTWGKKWTYVRSAKIKNHFRSYNLNEVEQEKYQGQPKQSAIGEGKKLDKDKLRKQLSDLKASAKWREEVKTSGTLLDDVNTSIQDSLEEWSEGITAGNGYAELAVEAQLLRYFAGAGAQASWNPKEGNIAVRGDARAEFVIAEGRFTAAAYWPGRAGHMIQMTGPKTKKVYDAGLIRAGLKLELYGMAGASACAQLALEVDYSGTGKAGMRGKPAKKPISSKGMNLSDEIRDGAELSAAGDLFAGARAEGSIKGSLEWNSPESESFQALCNIGPGGQVQAGAGISGQFKIDYVGGKFRVLASASVCLGFGAGGKLEFDVDAKRSFEFSKYMAYMLYSVGYEFAEIIAQEAFDAWVAFSLWAIQTGKDISDAIEAFGDNVQDLFFELVALVEKEADNVALMEQVLAEPKALEYAPPEAKGAILYRLTRHGKLTKATSSNYDWDSLDTLGRRKRAVLTVCKKARSRAEFRNILQHMTANGAKDPEGWEDNYDEVQDFLNYGIDTRDMDQKLRDFESILAVIYRRLYDDPVLGYAFVDNDSSSYVARASVGGHAGFMVAGGYSVGRATPQFDDDPQTRNA